MKEFNLAQLIVAAVGSILSIIFIFLFILLFIKTEDISDFILERLRYDKYKQLQKQTIITNNEQYNKLFNQIYRGSEIFAVILKIIVVISFFVIIFILMRLCEYTPILKF